MKTKTIGWLAVIGALVVLFLWFKSSYNGMVTQHEAVKSQMGNVDNQYKRRADLIPNLVSTVKGYASHEAQTFEAITAARAKATQTTLNIDDAKSVADYNNAQGEVSSALSRLLMISENYPDLKANQNFLDLQTQLEGTENRIAVERRKFNEQAQAYNTYIKQFPSNIVASMFNFDDVAYFEASEAEKAVPEVKF